MMLVGRGFAFDDLKVGFRFRTHRRTIGEADRAAFINLSWLTEELFAVDEENKRRLVPGALDVKAPTVVGDTIHVQCEVTEHRLASKGARGLVRFANKVLNQRGESVLEYNPLRLLKKT